MPLRLLLHLSPAQAMLGKAMVQVVWGLHLRSLHQRPLGDRVCKACCRHISTSGICTNSSRWPNLRSVPISTRTFTCYSLPAECHTTQLWSGHIAKSSPTVTEQHCLWDKGKVSILRLLVVLVWLYDAINMIWSPQGASVLAVWLLV